MTRINPLQLTNTSSQTGAAGSPSSAGSQPQSAQLLERLVEALVTLVQQVEKQTSGSSLLSSHEQPGIGSATASGGGQRAALDTAFAGSGLGSGGSVSTSGSVSSLGTTGTGGAGGFVATGGSVSTGTTVSSTSTTSTGATGGVGAVAQSGSFSETQLHGYITQALSQGAGGDNSLSGPQNLPKWDPSTAAGKKNLDSFYNGIVSAQKQFYPQVPIDQFAKMMVAESAQESTLNPDIENGDGVIQANQSVRDDFAKYGKPLTDNQGNVIVSPGSANSTDPASCVMLWAWRTSSALAHGGNGPAQWGQNVAATQSNHLGNALSVWLQGPASQPFYSNGHLDTSSNYVSRIQSFYQKLGGSSADFAKLMGTQLGSSN